MKQERYDSKKSRQSQQKYQPGQEDDRPLEAGEAQDEYGQEREQDQDDLSATGNRPQGNPPGRQQGPRQQQGGHQPGKGSQQGKGPQKH